MHGSDNNELLRQGLRRKLTAEEETRLQRSLGDHPEGQAAWEAEMCLNHFLRELPDAPVSSNFTALVLRQVRHESQPVAKPSGVPGLGSWFSWSWPRKLALAAAALSVGVFSYYQYQVLARKELARSVVTLSELASLPSKEMLENFEAIQRLHQAPKASAGDVEFVELLAKLH